MPEKQRRQERLAIAFAGTQAGIWDVDWLTGDMYVDKQCKTILGYGEAEITGSLAEWRSRLHPNDVKYVEQAGRRYLTGKSEKYEISYRLQHKDGSYRWILTTGKITRDKAERPIRWTGFFIDITKRREVEFAYDLQRRSDCINDIIGGIRREVEPGLVIAEKWRLQVELPFFCCLVQLRLNKQTGLEAGAEQVWRMKRELIALLIDQPGCLVWECRNDIGVLCQPPTGEAGRETRLKLAAQLRGKIRKHRPAVTVMMGVSEESTGINGIGRSYEQARSAVLFGQCTRRKGDGIFLFRDIGIFQLLVALSGQEQTLEFIESQIGRLIAYDRQKGTKLLHTLEEILQGPNLKQVADKMYLHHKTMVFRKQRIETILGRSIDLFEVRIALAAAIKLYKLNFVLK